MNRLISLSLALSTVAMSFVIGRGPRTADRGPDDQLQQQAAVLPAARRQVRDAIVTGQIAPNEPIPSLTQLTGETGLNLRRGKHERIPGTAGHQVPAERHIHRVASPVTAIRDLLDSADRARLLERLRHLEQLATFVEDRLAEASGAPAVDLLALAHVPRRNLPLKLRTCAHVRRVVTCEV